MKFFILFIIVSFIGSAEAQDLEFNFSKEILLRKHDEYQGLIHADSSGYLTHIYERSGKGLLGQPGRKLILEKYDTNLDLVYSYEYGSEGMISLELCSTGSSLAWIVMEKTGSYKYDYSMIPIGHDGKEGKKQFLFDNEVNSAKDIPYTNIVSSPDSSRIAFTAVFDSNSKKKKTEVYSAVFDRHGKLLWNKFTSLRGNQKQYNIEDFRLTNEGELLMLSKYYQNEKGKNTVKGKNNKKEAGYTMNIFLVNRENKLAKKIPIELKRSFVHQASMIIDSVSGQIYCAGLTSVKSGGNINGVFVSQFDGSLNLMKSEQRNFSTQDLIALHKKDADISLSANKEGLDDDYVLSSLHLSPSGALTIVAEENYVRRSNNNIGGVGGIGNYNNSSMSSLELYSNDIVLVNITPLGEIGQLNVLPKKQVSNLYTGRSYINPNAKRLRESDLFLSHNIMNHYGDLYFFYNEHEDNFDALGKRKTVASIRRMRPAIVHSSSTLETELNPLFGSATDTFVLSPTRSRQIDANTYFVTLVEPTANNRRYIRLGLIKFD